MGGNVVKINGSKKLTWFVDNTKMNDLMNYLNKIGIK